MSTAKKEKERDRESHLLKATAAMIGTARQIGGTVSKIFLQAIAMPIVLKITGGTLGSVRTCRKICTCKRRGTCGKSGLQLSAEIYPAPSYIFRYTRCPRISMLTQLKLTGKQTRDLICYTFPFSMVDDRVIPNVSTA